MGDRFDPYHRWLGIPPHEQPPHHYRLLGLAVYEDDPDVIESAADRQMTHVRSHQTGKRAEHVERLLNEITAAKLRLLDKEQKATYDEQLKKREQTEAAEALPTAKPLRAATTSPSTPHEEDRSVPTIHAKPDRAAGLGATQRANRRVTGGLAPLVVALVAGGVLLVALVLGVAGVYWISKPGASGSDQPAIIAAGMPSEGNGELDAVPARDPSDAGYVDPASTQSSTQLAPRGLTDVPTETVDSPVEERLLSSESSAEESPLKEADELSPEEIAWDIPLDPQNDTAEPNQSRNADRQADLPPHIAALFPPEEPDKRWEVPEEGIRRQRQTEIAELFSLDDARTARQQSQLARRLLQTGRETEQDRAGCYVLLDLARQLAVDAGDVELAMMAVDELNASFQVDGDAMRLASIVQAARATDTSDAATAVLDHGIRMVDQLLTRDSYVEAAKLIRELFVTARRKRNTERLAALRDRQRLGTQLYEDYRAMQAALRVLKADHDDANAALVVGRYQALTKGDWQLGLPLLAIGSDPQLKQLAEQEMAIPTAPQDVKKLADAWYELAGTADGIDADRQRARARMWYDHVQNGLTGLSRVAVQRRLKELESIDVEGGKPFSETPAVSEVAGEPATAVEPSQSSATRNPVDLLAVIDPARHGVLGTWRKAGDDLITPCIPTFARLVIPYHPPEEYDLEIEATRNVGGNELTIGLLYQGKQCLVQIDRFSRTATDLGVRSDPTGAERVIVRLRQRDVLPAHRRCTVKCAVRKHTLLVTVNGENVIKYDGRADWPGIHKDWQIPDEKSMLIGAWYAEFRIHSIKLTPVE